MIKFLDGPAAGHVLQLQRVPVYLRVTIDPAGDVDALDQLDDEPRDEETLSAYVLTGTPTRAHMCRSPRRLSGFVIIAAYRLVEDQPAESVMRDTAAWQAWAHTHAHVRTCVKCGCTDDRACVVDGVPCHWVAEDLCSACERS